MSSSKASKQDLLVRVRYQNPLPPPPFPPRLLHVPTTPARYASYAFLNPLQSERELPMILDGELGLPLEYGKSRSTSAVEAEYWLGNRDIIAPRKTVPQPLADEDAFLFEEPTTRAGGSNGAGPGTGQTVGSGASAAATESKKVDVSWLRRTEYLANETAVGGNKPTQLAPKREPLMPIGPQDRDSRARNIAATFETAHIPLTELRHPTKQHLTATEAFDFLPDSELWAHEFDFVRFGEDPIDHKTADLNRTGPDPRVPRAIFRDLTDLPRGEERLAYYLPQDDATANNYTGKRFEGGVSEAETFDFRWTRDYEVASTRAIEHEYVVSFDSGTIEEDGATEAEVQAKPDAIKKRRKGAYYVPVQGVTALRKRRPKKGEDPKIFPESVDEDTQFWDGISVQLVPKEVVLEEEKLQSWAAYKAEVDQPPAED
ncbi:uncharacterized protein JCM15063_001303 [Sporobolomyces koalae]|uniref:uncharacterized protein n=1 Tax=Sporobolomyces koalae TaxID=500713 RepID=UPI003171B219